MLWKAVRQMNFEQSLNLVVKHIGLAWNVDT